jgi:hypothetical protein
MRRLGPCCMKSAMSSWMGVGSGSCRWRQTTISQYLKSWLKGSGSGCQAVVGLMPPTIKPGLLTQHPAGENGECSAYRQRTLQLPCLRDSSSEGVDQGGDAGVEEGEV